MRCPSAAPKPPPLEALQPISQMALGARLFWGKVSRGQRISRRLDFPRDVSRGYGLFINGPWAFSFTGLY